MDSIKNYFTHQLKALKQNILAGVRLAFFQKDAFSRFQAGLDEAVFLILTDLVVTIAVGYLYFQPNPVFNKYGIVGFGMQEFGLLLTAFILIKLTKDNSSAIRFIVMVTSLSPLFGILITFIYTSSFHDATGYIITGWMFLVLLFILYHLNNRRLLRALITFAAYSLFVIYPSVYLLASNFWYKQREPDHFYDKYENINQEDLFYKQFDYLTSLKRNLLPGRPSTTDLYFLGFGSYATESVFKKEILYIKNLMDGQFDTKGRSIALINNLDTIDKTPLATESNLKRALKDIGQAMNPDEDVLMLYLTSHGSRKPTLSVSFWPLELNQITPEDLKQDLDESGIKWRVILISSCYSGGFLNTLKDENTIIMTAAAKDRTSFGCGSKSNFTYFGQAVFQDGLAKNFSFIPSFEKAKDIIAKREQRHKFTPSHPQLFVGSNIKPVLHRLEFELNRYYHR